MPEVPHAPGTALPFQAADLDLASGGKPTNFFEISHTEETFLIRRIKPLLFEPAQTS